MERTLVVTGRGFAAAEPDVANITVGVRTVASALLAAANMASTDMAWVIDLLRGLAIAGNDFKARRFSVYSQKRPLGAGGQCRRVTESVGSSLDDPEPLARAARVDAMRNAVARANKHVGAAGVVLGPIPVIIKRPVDGVHHPGGGLLSLGGATGGPAGSPLNTPVESGDITASAAVHLVWDLV